MAPETLNLRIARECIGYAVETSPTGQHYIVTDNGTRPLPDFAADLKEMLMAAADWSVDGDCIATFRHGEYTVLLRGPRSVFQGDGKTLAMACCKALEAALNANRQTNPRSPRRLDHRRSRLRRLGHPHTR